MKALLKKIQKFLKQKKGFTLIELLVVIGVLGILAASLLITIDPFEQLKKGKDTTTRGAAVDYLDAMTRYYATHGVLPWAFTPAIGSSCLKPSSAVPINDSSMVGCTTALETEGELKSGFGAAMVNETHIRVQSSGVADSADIKVGFSPTSKSLKSDVSTIQDDTLINGTTPVTGCTTVVIRAGSSDLTCWQVLK